jgi:hypothetical protein
VIVGLAVYRSDGRGKRFLIAIPSTQKKTSRPDNLTCEAEFVSGKRVDGAFVALLALVGVISYGLSSGLANRRQGGPRRNDVVVSLRLVLMLETTVKWLAMLIARGGRSIPHSFALACVVSFARKPLFAPQTRNWQSKHSSHQMRM